MLMIERDYVDRIDSNDARELSLQKKDLQVLKIR